MQYLHASRHQNTNMIQTYEDEVYDSSPICVSYFSSVILFASVYPLPLTMRYRYMPLATPAPVMLVPFHTALLTIFSTFGICSYKSRITYKLTYSVAAEPVNRLYSQAKIKPPINPSTKQYTGPTSKPIVVPL